MRDLSSPTRDQTCLPWLGRWSLNHWTTSSVQLLSRIQLFVTPWAAAHQASLSITNSRSLLNSCPWWVGDAIQPSISSSVVPFSSSLQSFPASRSFQMSQPFVSGGQSIGVSALASVLLINIQVWFPLGLTGLISLLSKGLPRVFSNTFLCPTLTSIHDYWKNHIFDQMDLCCQSNVSDFIFLSRLVIAFIPRSKHLLISWLQSPSAVILEPPKLKSDTVSLFPHLFPMKWWDQMP